MLYEKSNIGTKQLIEDFHEEVVKCLKFIYEFDDERELSYKEKVEFFLETKQTYGATALLLSGGASMAVYHIGVVKALYDQDLLPKIICGSSAGSIVAALICTRPYEELEDLFDPHKFKWDFYKLKEKHLSLKIARFVQDGVIYDMDHLQTFLKSLYGDLTFIEAYKKFGWNLNVSVSILNEKDGNRILNYLTSPNVLIWSGVSASCAIPNVFSPVELMCKMEDGQIVPLLPTSNHKYIDGSIVSDLPMQRLSEQFSVNNFIVSQVNPYVVPFCNEEGGGFTSLHERFYKAIKALIGGEFIHWIN